MSIGKEYKYKFIEIQKSNINLLLFSFPDIFNWLMLQTGCRVDSRDSMLLVPTPRSYLSCLLPGPAWIITVVRAGLRLCNREWGTEEGLVVWVGGVHTYKTCPCCGHVGLKVCSEGEWRSRGTLRWKNWWESGLRRATFLEAKINRQTPWVMGWESLSFTILVGTGL